MLKDHWSMAGGTCWVCGHSALHTNRRKKLFGEEWFRVCAMCAETKGTPEQIRVLRDAGLERLINLKPGESWERGYWEWEKPLRLYEEWKEVTGEARQGLREWLSKPYADEFAKVTAERLTEAHREYRRDYAKTRKEQMKENYQNGGKEAARERYENGGGREYAKAYYQKKKEAKLLAEAAAALLQKSPETGELSGPASV